MVVIVQTELAPVIEHGGWPITVTVLLEVLLGQPAFVVVNVSVKLVALSESTLTVCDELEPTIVALPPVEEIVQL